MRSDYWHMVCDVLQGCLFHSTYEEVSFIKKYVTQGQKEEQPVPSQLLGIRIKKVSTIILKIADNVKVQA